MKMPTTDEIELLREASQLWGDHELVRICDEALRGEPDAIEACAMALGMRILGHSHSWRYSSLFGRSVQECRMCRGIRRVPTEGWGVDVSCSESSG